MRGMLVIMVLLLPAIICACRQSDLAGVSDTTFVATMAELELIERNPALDSSAKAAARQQVLQGRGLTVEQLEQAARMLARDPDRASHVWRRIDSARQGAPPPMPRPHPPLPSPGGR